MARDTMSAAGTKRISCTSCRVSPDAGDRSTVHQFRGFPVEFAPATRTRLKVGSRVLGSINAYAAKIVDGQDAGGGPAWARTHEYIAIPLATPALMDRVEPNWAMENVASQASRAPSESPGLS